MPRVILATVAGGEIYKVFARQLMASAQEFFRPSDDVSYLTLDGVEGWPNGTLFRYHCLWSQVKWEDDDYVFLCDADMRFEAPVGDEVLADGLVATQHPGYVGMLDFLLPYETRPESLACVRPGTGKAYYAGGFVGGKGDAVRRLCSQIMGGIQHDIGRGIIARWHDESHLNRHLVAREPALSLTPSYCYPDRDGYYKTIWTQEYPRILIALDKTVEQRGNRES